MSAEKDTRNLRIDPAADAIRAVLREADDTWMPSQARALFERLWDIVGGSWRDAEEPIR